MDPGLGKTATTLLAVLTMKNLGLGSRTLVVAPKSVAESVWSDEVSEWAQFQGLRVSVVVGNEKQRIQALNEEADLYVINVEAVPWLSDIMKKKLRADLRRKIREAKDPERLKKRLEAVLELENSRNWETFFDVLVVDESTRFKSTDSVGFRRLKRILGFFKRRFILTGTPAPNGLLDLWTQIYILDQGERLGRTMTEYKARFFRRGGFMDRDFFPLLGAKEAIEERISDIVFRLDANDHLDLPEILFNDVWVEIPPKAMKVYKSMEREFIAELESQDLSDDSERDSLVALSGASKYLVCRQLANGGAYVDGEARFLHDAKVDAVESIFNELGGKPLLVLYQFWHDLERLEKRFGKRPAMNSETKSFRPIVDDWNADRIPLLFAQPQSMSHGLNMQKGSGRDVIFFGLTDNLDVYEQAYKRVYRQGVDSRVRVHRILARRTVDSMIRNRIDRKAGYQKSILDALKEYANARPSK